MKVVDFAGFTNLPLMMKAFESRDLVLASAAHSSAAV